MNKTELVSQLSEEVGLSKKDGKIVVDALFDLISNGMVQDGEVNVPPFGKFKVTERAARTGRNPQTGESMDIPAKMVPKFSPSKGLKEKVAG
jgi:DNA-binding protein HU-beta